MISESAEAKLTAEFGLANKLRDIKFDKINNETTFCAYLSTTKRTYFY